mmetsp:Transcript_20886/g.3378  ORF Transcript_20886/g.3378 Transcript_20886/m.3378 type:complete len:101 (-) Transcript_20886:33-335(-)
MQLLISGIVTSITAILFLNSEDYRWNWMCIISGFSISLYTMIYSLYFYLFQSEFTTLFQSIYYFGYSAIIATIIGTMNASFGYLFTKQYISYLYYHSKND